MSDKKKVSNLTKLFLFSIISFFLSIQIAFATPSLGNETIQTVELATDGIKSFLNSFAGPYFFIVIIGFSTLIILGIFAMMQKILGG